MEAFHRPLVCHLTSKVICPCVDGPQSIGRLQMLKFVEEYRQALYDLVISLWESNFVFTHLIFSRLKLKVTIDTKILQLYFNQDWPISNYLRTTSPFLAYTNLFFLICLTCRLTVFILVKNYMRCVSTILRIKLFYFNLCRAAGSFSIIKIVLRYIVNVTAWGPGACPVGDGVVYVSILSKLFIKLYPHTILELFFFL